MYNRQQGFTLIIVLTVLVVLSLIVMSTFEQAQWVKRGSYSIWRQVTIQDRMWQQLVEAERALPKRVARAKCFAPYSVANDYFFANKRNPAACRYNFKDQHIEVIYECIARNPCAQIKNIYNRGGDFFRVTIHSLVPSSRQKTILQSIVVLPLADENSSAISDQNTMCIENKLYLGGRQSWLLQ